jgi:hypothetical protein
MRQRAHRVVPVLVQRQVRLWQGVRAPSCIWGRCQRRHGFIANAWGSHLQPRGCELESPSLMQWPWARSSLLLHRLPLSAASNHQNHSWSASTTHHAQSRAHLQLLPPFEDEQVNYLRHKCARKAPLFQRAALSTPPTHRTANPPWQMHRGNFV